MNRLPCLQPATDKGFVYVLKSEEKYKIGFSRRNVKRRAADHRAEILLAIPVQHPSTLECLLHQRFKDKRTTGFRSVREWFNLDDSDLEWLHGLAQHIVEFH